MDWKRWNSLLSILFLFVPVILFGQTSNEQLVYYDSISGEIIITENLTENYSEYSEEHDWEANSLKHQEYLESPIHQKDFDQATVDSISKVINESFSDPKPEEPEPDQKKSFEETTEVPIDGGGIFQIILIILVILILVFVLYKLLGGKLFLGNQKIEKGIFASIDEAAENLVESDLEAMLRIALENEEFRLALRVKYLMIIKALAENKLIVWKKDKTNNSYLREMRKHPSHWDFWQVTRTFESLWYGEIEFEKKDYFDWEPSFSTLLKTIELDKKPTEKASQPTN